MIARRSALSRWSRSSLWGHGDFLRLWSAQTISAFGSQVSALALPFVAISILDVSAFQVAALTTVELLPFMLFSLPAGVWVDRLSRRPILIIADWGRGVALATIPLAYGLDILTIWQLYAVGFVVGTLTVFFDVAYQSYLPSLVERAQLAEGNSKLEVTRSGAQIGGPGLAGVLISALTAPVAVVLDAASFAASALFVTRITRREVVERATTVSRSMKREIAEGLHFVLSHPYMRPSLIYVAISNFLVSGLVCDLPGLRRPQPRAVRCAGRADLFDRPCGQPDRCTRRGSGRGPPRNRANDRWCGCARQLGIPPHPDRACLNTRALRAAGLFVFGVCGVTVNVVGISLSQAVTPDRLLGRMTASRRFVVWGVIPLGSLTAGALASTLGLKAAIWVCAVGASVAFVPMLLSPVRSVRTLDDADSALGLSRKPTPAEA